MQFRDIKNINDAFKASNMDINAIPDMAMYPEHRRDFKKKEYVLETGIDAINGPDWDGKYDDPTVQKWIIIWNVVDDASRASGRGLSFSDVFFVLTAAVVGPRQTFESREKALHGAEVLKPQFEDFYLR